MKKILLLSSLLIALSVVFANAEDAKLTKLKDRKENPFARQAMAKLLVKEANAETGPALETIVKDSNEELKMRVIAAKYLGELAYKEAGPALLDIIKNKDEDIELRQASVEAVGTFADKQTLINLGTGIVAHDNYSNQLSIAYIDSIDKSSFKRDKDVLLTLGQFLGGNVRAEAKKKSIALLANSNDKQTITILMICLMDKTPPVRKEAIKSISKLAGSAAVPLYISKLEEEKKDDIRAIYADELLTLPVPKLKKYWFDELEKRIGEEGKNSTKTKLEKVLVRIKKAQEAPEAGGAIGQKTFSAPANAVAPEAPKVPAKKK